MRFIPSSRMGTITVKERPRPQGWPWARVWALSWALLAPLRPRFIDFSTAVKWLIGLSGFKRSALHGNWHNFRPRATFPTILGAYELALNPPTQRAWCRDHRARAFTRILKVA